MKVTLNKKGESWNMKNERKSNKSIDGFNGNALNHHTDAIEL